MTIQRVKMMIKSFWKMHNTERKANSLFKAIKNLCRFRSTSEFRGGILFYSLLTSCARRILFCQKDLAGSLRNTVFGGIIWCSWHEKAQHCGVGLLCCAFVFWTKYGLTDTTYLILYRRKLSSKSRRKDFGTGNSSKNIIWQLK